VKGIRSWAVLLLSPILVQAQVLKEFEKKVTEFTLPNGLHFIIAERHEAPVVSFHTYVNAGSVDDPSGQTGMAHMFEHMAFKGTETIGTTNWPEEKKALDAIEGGIQPAGGGREQRTEADAEKIRMLGEQVKMAVDRAETFVIPNEFPRLIEENGGAGLNAGNTFDSTEYFYSYLEPRRIMVPSGIAALSSPVFRGILQKTRCGAGGESDARRIECPGETAAGFSGYRHLRPIRTATSRRMAERCCQSTSFGARASSRSITCRLTSPSLSSAT